MTDRARQPARITATVSPADAARPIRSIELHADDQCWATLSRDAGDFALCVRTNPDGGPWRVSRQGLSDALATARTLLG